MYKIHEWYFKYKIIFIFLYFQVIGLWKQVTDIYILCPPQALDYNSPEQFYFICYIFLILFLYLFHQSFALHNVLITQLSAVTMKDLDSKKPAKYADSSISDKAFKNMIIWFAIYCGLFCIGVIFFVGADQNCLLQ